MPLPRYQPLRKRPKINGPSIEDLDDYCLSKIIGHALSLASSRDDGSKTGDNGKSEKNLSLVSKRWYFLTQAQAALHGVHKINLDTIPRGSFLKSSGRLVYGSVTKKSNVLTQQKNNSYTTMDASKQQVFKQTTHSGDSIALYRLLRPKLLKYKHILIEGALTCEELKRLVVSLDSARVERLDLKVKVEKDRTLAKDFGVIPSKLCYLEKLTLSWTNDVKSEYSNGLTWTIFERATKLKTLEVHLNDETSFRFDSNIEQSKGDSLERIVIKYLNRPFSTPHTLLRKVVFKRNSSIEPSFDCSYTSLMKGLLLRENSISQVDTNDNMLMEYLIKSSNRICTTHELKTLKFLAPIKKLDLLAKLVNSRSLGTDHLSIVIDSVEQLEEVRHLMENFKLIRHDRASCQLGIHLKDQKFSDFEDKIKNLVHLCRATDVTMHITVQQRVSIDCCHLMWSIGRALQSSSIDTPGRCLFKISLQNPLKQNTNSYSEITIPFGKYYCFKINSSREDLLRYREIMKSVKKDCYHQFVKSVRDNVIS